LLWIAPEASLAEDGAPYAPGLAQFGFSLPRLLLVRTRTQGDAYWAAEQSLAVPKAHVLCAVARRARLTLVASRRLLLAAEKSGARCLLLRFDDLAASASWSRWRIAAAPSEGPARELGRPRFLATIERDRAGRAGRRWLVEWSADDHGFKECALDGDLAERSVDGSFAPRRRRAG
jgi:protein ImuA